MLAGSGAKHTGHGSDLYGAVHEALATATQRNLLTAAWGLGVAYALFCVMHALSLLPSVEGVVLVSLTFASAVSFFGFALLRRGRPPSARAAELLASVFAYIVLANVTTHFVLMREWFHGYNYALFQVGAGALILSRRWLLTILASGAVALWTGSALAVHNMDWALATIGMAAATAIGYLVHIVRVRMLSQLVRLERAAEARKREAEAALVGARRSELALHRAQRDLREIIEKDPDGVIVHRDGVIVYANASFASLLRAPTERSFVGDELVELVADSDRDVFADKSSDTDLGKRSEVAFVRADDEEVVLELSPPQRIMFEDAAATLTVARDVTQRHADQHAKLLLADRMSAIGTLAAGVAHEINNPLAYVLLNLVALDNQMRDPAVALPEGMRKELLEIIADARGGAERVKSIVHNIKAMSRVDSHERSQVDVCLLVEGSVKMAAGQILPRCRLVKQLDPVSPVWANRARLGQVLLNMVINAAQSIPEGDSDENTITVATRTARDGRVVVEISDTGGGMAPETKRRVFEPFYTTKPDGVGTGLGLYYCHTVVQEEGGEIEVETELSHGSTFRILLPPLSAESPVEVSVEPPAKPSHERAGMRVLVIDDEPSIGRALARLLAKHGCEVSVAISGRDGMEQLRSQSFDLVFCDLMIPDVPGWEIHSAIRELRPGFEKRIVFITGGAFTPKASAFLQDLDNPILHKPIDLNQLDKLVDDVAARLVAQQARVAGG